MLLYKDGNFMQVLGGPDAAVTELMQTVERDNRHGGVIVLTTGPIEARQLPSLSMAFRDLGALSAEDAVAFSRFLAESLLAEEFRRKPDPGCGYCCISRKRSGDSLPTKMNLVHMLRRCSALLLLTGWHAAAQDTSVPFTPPRIVEIPLLDCSGLPCVDMTTGSGKTLRLLIDLGEINSYLDSKAAQSLGVYLQGLKGDAGASQVQQTVVPDTRLGDLPMGDFPFMVLDTTPQPDKPGQKPQTLPGDGALTFTAFKNRLLQLDYARRVVRISEPQDTAPPCPHDCADLVIKRFGRFGPATLTATGFAVNGTPVEVQIDTLFTGTMLIYPTSVEKLGLKREAKAKHKEFFPFTQGGLKLAQADGAAESFKSLPLLENGPLYFLPSGEPTPSVQFDATLGTGLLNHALATFDFKGMHLWMDPGTPPAPAGH